jgi:hypothetical protein
MFSSEESHPAWNILERLLDIQKPSWPPYYFFICRAIHPVNKGIRLKKGVWTLIRRIGYDGTP